MVERELKTYILTLADIMARESGLKLTTVSRRVHGTDVFMKDFRAGRRTVTLSGLEKMLRRFYKLWPKGVDFPEPPMLSTPGRKKKHAPADESTTTQAPEGNGAAKDAAQDDSGNPPRGTGDELRGESGARRADDDLAVDTGGASQK